MGFGFKVLGFGFWVLGLGFGVWGLRFGVWGSGVGVWQFCHLDLVTDADFSNHDDKILLPWFADAGAGAVAAVLRSTCTHNYR